MEHNTTNSFLPTFAANPSRYRWMMCKDSDAIETFSEGVEEQIKVFVNNRNDIEFLKFLREAWYHKAPSDSLVGCLDMYCRTHKIELAYNDNDELEERSITVIALLTAHSLQVVNGEEWDPITAFELCKQIMPKAGDLMVGMLEEWQEGGRVCDCVGCTTEVAALN